MRFFDLHCDTLYECLKENKNLKENDLQISLEKGKNISKWVQCFAIWIPDEYRGEKALNLFKSAYIKLVKEYLSNNNSMLICREFEDIKTAIDSNRCACIFTVEGSSALGGDLNNIYLMKELGVKIVTLTWNGSSEVGDGILVSNSQGISDFGKKAVKLMEDNNIIIDVSHASDELFSDILTISKKPFIASHSNSREICSNKRNLTDEQFLEIKNRQGLVGLNFYKLFINEEKDLGFSGLMNHLEHFLSLGGERIVAIGSDFDGCDTINDIDSLIKIENFYEYLLKHNYSEELIDRLFFNNCYEFFERYSICK